MGFASKFGPRGYQCIFVLPLFCVALFCVKSYAQNSETSISIPQSSILPSKKSLESKNYFSIELQQYNYNSGAETTNQMSQFTQLSPQFNYENETQHSEDLQTKTKVQGLFVLPMSAGTHFEVALPNAYWSFKLPNRNFRLSVGREIHNWSELDDFWHLGIWQPLARWDAVDPISQGLTGVFAEISEKRFRLLLFGSDLFLPDQQPDFKESNGQLSSDNRWFRAPVPQVTLGSSESSVQYHIAPVDPKSVVLQRSFALMTEFGRQKSGPYFKAAVAQKPVNQFHVALDVSGVYHMGTNDFHVNVLPLVITEHVLTAEGGYRFGDNTEVLLSDTWERFVNPNLSDNYEQAELIDSQYVGAIYRQNLTELGVHDSQIAFSYIERVKETNPQTDTIVQGQVESSADRLSFNKLAGVRFKKRFWHNAISDLNGELGYTYSIDDEGEWAHLMVNYQYDPHWTWSFAGDVFGLPASQDNSDSFISKYRANDRLMGGLTYVF